MRLIALAVVLGCNTPPTKPVTQSPGSAAPVVAADAAPAIDAAASERTLHFEGAITDLNFGCWSDNDCGVKVDDVWIMIPGGMRDDPPPAGKVIGFSIGNGSADEVRRQLIGKRVEVYAAKMPIYDTQGFVRGYDAKKLVLEGDTAYYIRAK